MLWVSWGSARQELTHVLATGAAMPLGRDYLRRLADCVHDLAVTSCCYWRPWQKGLLTYDLQGLTRTFVEARITARQAAAKATMELAQRGVVKALCFV
ncbi:hypothetical protein Pmani_001804 [Petrolisthes manimaculis]|uniref:Uncharacterized protein n=1 Tax=Petrolisthes manimaculis TaxID=1843537 RepID=A0AAE1QMC4_9EUCA|nr:hypothetical protein Pmani_027264 [Petrolisthes manimaculis]KAK4327762.1 hypothetical protein Pmani_001804 [Petrolisthes manimaculis]